MTWIRMIQSFLKIRKFIRDSRKRGISSFIVLTTRDRIILYDDPPENGPSVELGKIRITVPNL